MNYLRLIVIGVLALCWIGCGKETPKKMTLDITPLLVEYVVEDVRSGSIRELFVITSSENYWGFISNIKRENSVLSQSVTKEIYLVSESTAKDVFAILKEHDVIAWEFERSGRPFGFLMSFTVHSPSLFQTVSFHELPDGSGDSQKKFKALIEKLRTSAKKEGRLLTVKKPE